MIRVAAFLLALAAAPAVSAEPVDLELVLAADGSGSIDDEEFALQRRGYAAAITHPRVLAAIRAGYRQKIALAYMEWAAPDSQHTIVDWVVIGDEQSARAFAEKLVAAPRQAIGYNSISNAVAYSAAMIHGNAHDGARKIIDVSGDGPQMNGLPLEPVRQEAVRSGITINALVIKSPGGGARGPGGIPLDQHYRRDVIGGPGAFVMIAEDRDRFAQAILAKMVQEIAGVAPENGSPVRVADRR